MAVSDPNPKVAESLLGKGIVWDNHGCLPLRADAEFIPQLRRYKQAGVDVVSINVGFGDVSFEQHVRMLSFFRQWLMQRPEEYLLVQTADDVRQCKSDGRLGVFFDIEGMCPVEAQPSFVQTFYELGVRWMLVAYNKNNLAGGGCLDTDTGLTEIGRAAIDEMNRVGMLLCLSHTGQRTAIEAMERTRHPVIFSHSNPYGVTPHARNISDDLLRRCAKTGGVVGLSGIGPFLGGGRDLVESLVRQVLYVADLVGPQHVGLGLDYVFDRQELDDYLRANPGQFPADLLDNGSLSMIEPEQFPAIAEALSRAGLPDESVLGVLGENWLRVASAVWR